MGSEGVHIKINIHDTASMHSTSMIAQNDKNQTNGPSITTMHVIEKMCQDSGESASIQHKKKKQQSYPTSNRCRLFT